MTTFYFAKNSLESSKEGYRFPVSPGMSDGSTDVVAVTLHYFKKEEICEQFSNEKCFICLSPLLHGSRWKFHLRRRSTGMVQNIMSTCCGHGFHIKCWGQYTKNPQTRDKCPVCKQSLDANSPMEQWARNQISKSPAQSEDVKSDAH
jgi:hypothetical protein